MELIKLGSIWFSNEAQIPGFNCDGSGDISFGDAVPEKELQWVKLKSGLLVADRCICTDISWEQLAKKGFVFGTPITIAGETYWCRCLQVGSKRDEPNEWDPTLNEAGEDNELWHWEEGFFWGQETPEESASSRAVRGWVSARFWDNLNATFRDVYVGFRPALEHLGSESCSPVTLVDKKAKAYCPDGITIEGRMVDFSDYDVVLDTDSQVPADCPWITRDGCNIIVSRENIRWMKEG